MGGRGSGQHGAPPTAEAMRSLAVDVNDVMVGFTRVRGVWKEFKWSRRGTLLVNVPPCLYEPHAVLSYRRSDSSPSDWQRVPLVSIPAPLGGVMWFFVCPLTNKRSRRLILPLGFRIWASRRGYGLGYASQRETVIARAVRRAHRLERKIIDRKLNRHGRKVRFQRRTLDRLCREAALAMRTVETMARL